MMSLGNMRENGVRSLLIGAGDNCAVGHIGPFDALKKVAYLPAIAAVALGSAVQPSSER
jgi:hypothetical protein